MILRKMMCFTIESSDSDLAHTAPCSPDSLNMSPSPPHPQQIMNLEEEVRSLWAEMKVQQRQSITIQETLDTLLTHLGDVDSETQWGALPPLCLTALLSNTGFIPVLDEEDSLPPIVCNHMKPRVPPTFDSDHTKGHAFMNSCVLYQLKILWSLTMTRQYR